MFQLARVKFGRGGEGGTEALEMRYFRINVRDGLELELAYFPNSFPISLLSDNSNISVFKVCDVLHRVHFLVMKTFSNTFRGTFCWDGQLMYEYDLYLIYFLLLLTKLYLR